MPDKGNTNEIRNDSEHSSEWTKGYRSGTTFKLSMAMGRILMRCPQPVAHEREDAMQQSIAENNRKG